MSATELEALLAEPAMKAPNGVIPDFDDPPNENGLAWFIITLCMIVATVCLLLRAFARVYLQRKVQIEDGK